MGTALTERQLDALKRLTPKVLLCQDPDAAGQEAVEKGKDAIRAFNEAHALRGFELRVVRLPAGRDPADVVQQDGAEAMRSLLETSVPVARFEVERAIERGDLSSPEGRDDALRAVAPVVKRLEPGALQYDLIQLTSSRLRIPEAVIEEALRRAPRDLPRNGDRAARARRPPGHVRRPPRGDRARVPGPLPRGQGRRPPGAGGDGHRRVVLARADPPRRALPRRAPRASRASRCPPAPTTSPSSSPGS